MLIICTIPCLLVEAQQSGANARYGEQEMEQSRQELKKSMGGGRVFMLEVDRLEYQLSDDQEGLGWDGGGWYGSDKNRLWFSSEGETIAGEDTFDEVQVQAGYSRYLTDFFDLRIGVRHDFKPHPVNTYAMLGVQGLAPQWIEVRASAYMSDEADISMRFEAEYDLRLTQRLIWQPSLKLNFALQDVDALGIGSGLSTLEAAMLLRYEIVREFAPYIGVSIARDVGETADFTRAAGEDPEKIAFVTGLRLWF